MTEPNGNHAVLHAFVSEARERLAAIDRKLDALQSRPGNEVLWSAISRDFQAVTRGAAFFDVGELLALCQPLELLMGEVRDGEVALSAELREVIVAATRAVLAMLEDIAHGRPPSAAPAVLARLKAAVPDASSQRIYE